MMPPMGRPLPVSYTHLDVYKRQVIKGAIVDKNARLGSNVTIRYIPDRPDEEGDYYVARDGIIIVPKGATVPDGTVI